MTGDRTRAGVWSSKPPRSLDLNMDNISVSSSNDDETLHSPSQNAFFQSFPRGISPKYPLINYVTNKWDTSRSSRGRSLSTTSNTSFDRHRYSWMAFILSIVTAPRFRRYMVVYAVLVVFAYVGWDFFLQPMLEERKVIIESLDVAAMDKVGGWYGTNLRPEFADIVTMRTLSPDFLPRLEKSSRRQSGRRRLLIVGDVHGCQYELERLLKKVSFDQTAGDHLIFTGDMISKGPASAGVVDIARELGASCVRGNHEDRILLLRSEMKLRNILSPESVDRNETAQSDVAERKIARELSDEQAAWLQECPVMLKLGSVTGMGDVVVVHGGLVPGVPLERQELTSVMSMRTIDLETHVPSSGKEGMPWFKLFNQYHKLLVTGQERIDSSPVPTMTVVYGHDASTSLNIRQYTKGLDSGCVYGRKLSALVIEDGGKNEVVQVKCNEYVKS
ncbi:hypothetical protein UA08_00658 [Talaromyces atroroseus]|uniref:Calcineurin-like phosphoesterase domain-containing protein n=1 Tax=Talaromyces atroroseus TaxID=1441469 RepID=A0A225B9C1_TALAT|nr:hypothetical protein UA08_00658 [Talaromyces atroroseus]OKL63996.1 hypothetical protein UA08_00658 [Talaromyces atroroseus]